MSKKFKKEYILRDNAFKKSKFDKSLCEIFKQLRARFPILVSDNITNLKCMDAEGIEYNIFFQDKMTIVKSLDETFMFIILFESVLLFKHEKCYSNGEIMFSSEMSNGLSDIYLNRINNKHNIVLVISFQNDQFFSDFKKMRLEFERNVIKKIDYLDDLENYIRIFLNRKASCVFIHDGVEEVIE